MRPRIGSKFLVSDSDCSYAIFLNCAQTSGFWLLNRSCLELCLQAMLVVELSSPGILAVERFGGRCAFASQVRSGIRRLQTEDYRGSEAGLVHQSATLCGNAGQMST